MSGTLLRLILIVSCAHALVHVYELSLPSVEQLIARDFDIGKESMGALATTFRLPFGLCAILFGWLVDRYGSKPLLAIYLLGCAVMAYLASVSTTLPSLFFLMFVMGTFASMYHPAGLALISIEAPSEYRSRALGMHGIFGSAGIGAAPFLAAAVLQVGGTWQDYYALLAIPGGVLGTWFLWNVMQHRSSPASVGTKSKTTDGQAQWSAYFLVIVFATMNGFIYSAFLTFLPRYLDHADTHIYSSRLGAEGNFLSGIVLLCGMFGQYVGGRVARPGNLEPLLMIIAILSTPLLAAMAWVDGSMRVYVAAAFSIVHFMTQPVYNSLIAEYIPTHRRSLGYGFSFTMAFGVGSVGSMYVGFSDRVAGTAYGDMVAYGTLAGIALLASLVAAILWRRNRG